MKLRDLLDREVERHDHEWLDTMQRLTITERTEKRPVTIRSRDVVRDCRSIVNQLVNSMPKDVLLRTSYTEDREATKVQTTEKVRIKSKSSVKRKVQFTEAKEEYEPCSDSSSGDETLSGESCAFEPRQDELSGESDSKRPRDRILSGESRIQPWKNTSETTSNSDVSEITIHSLLVVWKQRGLIREIYQDPDRDRYTSDEEGTVVDNAADELELIAVSKRPTRLLPHGTVVRTNLKPSVQEATLLKKIWCVTLMSKRPTRLLPHGTVVRTNLKPSVQEATLLKKIWCVTLMDDALAPEIISGQLNVMKTYLKARYRLSHLLRSQQKDRMTSNLKRWIKNGAPDNKRDLVEDSYKILKQFYLKRKDLLFLNKDGIVAFKRKEESKFLYKYNSIVLPQLYKTELFFRSDDQMGHQGVDKVYNRIQKRFE